MLREGFRVTGQSASFRGESSDGNVICVTVQTIRAKGNDYLRAQFANDMDNLFESSLLFLCTEHGSHAAVFYIEKAPPIYAQHFTRRLQFTLAHLTEGIVVGQRLVADGAPLAARRADQRSPPALCGILCQCPPGDD